jgi:hypothetical protein
MKKPAYTRPYSLRPRSGRPLWSKPAAVRRAPPSSALINAVLEHADLKDDMGGGRLLLRLSAEALDMTDFGFLGDEAAQLGGIAILWDEIEDQIVRVMDGRNSPFKPTLAASNATPAAADEPKFELTPEAKAYVKAHTTSRRRG